MDNGNNNDDNAGAMTIVLQTFVMVNYNIDCFLVDPDNIINANMININSVSLSENM